MEKSYANLKKLKAKDGEAEYELEIPTDVLDKESGRIIAETAKDFKLAGFRPGKVPLNIVREHTDAMRLLEEAADLALRNAIRELVTDEKLSAIGFPQITLNKIALGNPVSFKIRFGLMPEVTLPDYRKIGQKIAKREDKIEATDKDVEEALENLRKMVTPGEGGDDPAKLPELNDEFAKNFGPFENLEAFKVELRKQVVEDKKFDNKNKKRDETIKEIVKHSKVGAIAPLSLDEEYQNYVMERDEALKAANMTLEAYLKEVKKTAEELDKEMKDLIKERIKTRFVIQAIQKEEKLEADHDEVHRNMERLKRRYPDRDDNYLHSMAEIMILNEKLFKLLEETGPKEEKKSE